MSVILVMRIPGDSMDLEKYATGPGAEVMARVAAASKAAGAIRHTFAGNDDEIMVLDEWPDEQSFRAFFSGQPEIADIMRDGGAKGAPEITFYRKLDTPDQF